MFKFNTIKDSAVIYARCSTMKQNNEAGTSIHTQIAECMMYCNNNNYEILEVITEVISGHNSAKQSYNKVLEKYNNINFIVCDPSRLSRSACAANVFLDQCNKQKIVVHSVRDNLICNSLNNNKQFINLVFDAMIESNTISKRITNSINIRRQLGSYIGSTIPFGYKITKTMDKKTGLKLRKLVETSDEMDIIKLITSMYYGCKSSTFYKNLYKVDRNSTYKLEDMNQSPIDTLYYGNAQPKNIADVLNECNISCRDKNWNSNSIRKIVRKHQSPIMKYNNLYK